MVNYCDHLSPGDAKKADRMLAEAIYSSNSPLCLVENEYWKRFFQFLRPGYTVPTRYKIETPLLTETFDDAIASVKAKLQSAVALGLLSDGWTDVNNTGIINFIITTPQPVFYKSIDKEVNRETSAYIGGKICEVMGEVGPNKFYVAVTDCAPNMVGAWAKIQLKYPHICGIGCACHGLQNFLKNLNKLEQINLFFNSTTAIVKEFKTSHVKSANFKEIQAEKYGSKIQTLKLPPKTRFSYLVLTVESVLYNKAALQAAAISIKTSDDVRADILDEKMFWPRLQLLYTLLKPIATVILILKSDDALLSDAVEVFFKIRSDVEAFLAVPDNFFAKDNEDTVRKAFKKRFDMTIKPIHFAADLVDPRYTGEKLTSAERLQGYEYIQMLGQHLNIDDKKVIEDLGDFCAKSSHYGSSDVLWVAARNHKPHHWWAIFCQSQPVCPITIRLLQLHPTTSPAERNWSQKGDTHTLKRNRLKPEKVRKLVTIRSHLNQSSAKKSCQIAMSDFLNKGIHILFADAVETGSASDEEDFYD